MVIHPFDDSEVPPPPCAASVVLVQAVLRGEAPPEALGADPHPATCAKCRDLVRAVRTMFALPREPVAVPVGFADRVVQSMWAERHTRTRRRSYAAMIGALAAGVLLVIGLSWYFSSPPAETYPEPRLPAFAAQNPEVAPAPREKPDPAPEPRPIRFGEAVANTGQALRDAPNSLTDSVAVAPKLFDALADSFKRPEPPADPMATALEPARKSLAELPVAARTGLEPVTGTAEKAFARFLRDVGSVKPN